MEAATARELGGEKAQRIIGAMRSAVGELGASKATFDVVARQAGVSRGLLHYYFGTKERLLAEVVRRDCDIRMALLSEAVSEARSADAFIDSMVRTLEEMIEEDPGFMALLFELFTISRHNDELAEEMSQLARKTRELVAGLLEEAQERGIVKLGAPADAVAEVVFAMGDGIALRMLSEPAHDHGPALDAGVKALRVLIAAPV